MIYQAVNIMLTRILRSDLRDQSDPYITVKKTIAVEGTYANN